jgi:hypothetical protein
MPFLTSFSITILSALVVSSNAFAQQGAPAAGAGVGGSAPSGGGGASVGISGGAAGSAAFGSTPLGAASSGLSGGVYRPIGIGSMADFPSTAIPATPAMPMTTGAGGGMVSMLLNMCSQGLQAQSTSMQERAMLDDYNDKSGFEREKGISPERGRYYGNAITSLFPNDKGCEKFINQEGAVGPWGRTALVEMDNHKDVYEKNVPSDITNFCPTFLTMSIERRRYFWLAFFAAISKPESSCSQNAVNHNAPNGDAIGLFQLETPACERVGVHLSSQELFNAHQNTRCAVALFAQEMKSRPNIFTGHSRGHGATYFAELRDDDYNLARGGDIGAHKRTVEILRKYPDCKSTDNSSHATNANAQPRMEKFSRETYWARAEEMLH